MIRYLTLLLTCLTAIAVEMPLGIPMPPFGITNTHWMYHPDIGSKTFDYGSGAVPYRTNSYGPYVYYVDNTHGSATDTANTYGTPTTPRLTWPYPVAAGVVVMVANGGTYSFNVGDSSIKYGGAGTGDDPIFYIGVGATTNISDRPKINREYNYLLGNWTMIEGFTFTNNSKIVMVGSMKGGPITNVCARSNIFFGTGVDSWDVVFQNGSCSAANYVQNAVVFTNYITSYGIYTGPDQNDSCGAIFRDYSTNCWFLYNYVTKMGGDMVRCGSNANDTGDNCFTAYHYVGRNVTHQNGENAVDVKKAWKTVVSENVMYDMSYIPSAAPIVTAHYYPNYTWFINNIIHTGDYNGLETGAGMQPTNQVWLVGNVIYNLGESGIYFRGVPIVHMYGNSVYDCEWGFEVTDSGSGPTVRATNNIISDCNLYALLYPNSTARGNAQIGYDCYYKTGGGNLISWNTGYTSVASWIAAVTTGDNSIGGDPLFVSAGSANFKLQASSPCIGAGDSSNWSFIEAQFLEQFGFALNYHDLAGNTRVNDIGAYEYVSTVQKSKSTGRLKLSGKGKL